MNKITSHDFPRQFNSTKINDFRQKEIKKWQWIVLLCCFLMQMSSYSVAINLSSKLMANDWLSWFNNSQTIASLTFTIGAVGSALLGPFIAKLFAKNFNMRIIYSIGVSLAILGFFLPSVNILDKNKTVASAAVTLYISYLISQIGVMISSAIGVNNLISKWWPAEKRGLALGLAFTGGSVGNIWMQQLIDALSKKFIGDQRIYVYAIFAAITLTFALSAALVGCRKPCPPNVFEINDLSQSVKTEICLGCNNLVNKNSSHSNHDLDASFLTTRKYPLYWMLAIGFLLINMGVVHTSMAPTFLQKGVGISKSIVTTGLTLFGVSCIFGNFFGGVLNQRLGLPRSVTLAGMMQVASIVCLAFTVKDNNLIYVYYILNGLSVYVYTSTPSFLSGKLFGIKSSNSHVGIFGIFLALGFAITNSVIGSITGKIDIENTTTLVGITVNGNLQALIIYCSICMGLGSLIVAFCSFIILRKGIKGLNEYSPTKYTRIIVWKYSFKLWISSLLIFMTGKDYRINQHKETKQWQKYISKNKEYNTLFHYTNHLSPILKQQKLSMIETEILAYISMNELITLEQLKEYFVKVNEDTFNKLINSSLIKQTQLNDSNKIIELSDETKAKLNPVIISNKITKDNIKINKTISDIEKNKNKKIKKLTNKLHLIQVQEINETKKRKLIEKSNTRLISINAKLDKLLNQDNSNINEWVLYKKIYALLVAKQQAELLKNKLELDHQAKIKALQTKIYIANYIANFDVNKQVEGHNLLVNYYNDNFMHYNHLLDKNIANIFERKLNKLHKSKDKQQLKFSNLLAKESNIFSTKRRLLNELQKEQIDPLEVINNK